jgi:hypothetical protein
MPVPILENIRRLRLLIIDALNDHPDIVPQLVNPHRKLSKIPLRQIRKTTTVGLLGPAIKLMCDAIQVRRNASGRENSHHHLHVFAQTQCPEASPLTRAE